MTKTQQVFERLAKIYPSKITPVRKDLGSTANAYTSLISVVVSSRSQHDTVMQACERLFAYATNPDDMLKLGMHRIANLISAVRFYTVKAGYIIGISRLLLDRHDGQVPQTRAELQALPGVGRKTADFMLRFVFEKPTVVVDKHTHLIANRIGLVATNHEDKTADQLEQLVPEEYKNMAHPWLYSHAKNICKSTPQCQLCSLANLCDYYTNQQR